MKFSVFSASILLGTTATAISLPNPPAHSYGGGDHAAAGKKRPCTQAEIALATGIHLNINGQYGEYNGTVQVEQVETDASTKSDTKAFDLAKGKLVRLRLLLKKRNEQKNKPPNIAYARID